MSQNGMASMLQKNDNEHLMGTLGCADAERRPTLLDVERKKSTETVVKVTWSGRWRISQRSGWALNSADARGEKGGTMRICL